MWIMPQIALQKILQSGLRDLKDNPDIFSDIFSYMKEPDINDDYGDNQIDKIKAWFLGTKIPVLHAWTFNADRIPCISIHLANESEDESKAAVGDFYGSDENGDIGTTVLVTQLDVGIHASKNSDEVLWLYYIITYILFRNKLYAESLGLRLQTFTASDWERKEAYSMENVWTRWLRFRCLTENFWQTVDPLVEIDDLVTNVTPVSADDDC